MLRRIISLFLALVFSLQSAAMANPAMVVPAAEGAFCPVLARGISRGPEGVRFSLDKGDVKTRPDDELARLSGYFNIGLALPNDAFWVNLRPDGGARMIDPDLERTDMGRVLLAADVQLKKDLALLTSPATETGRKYWDKLYAKAETLAGRDASSIPTLSRPWIVPGEVVMVQEKDGSGVHIYKALLKVMLEQDYLKDSPTYSFKDERSKELNDYAAGLIRELIIPRLNKDVNSARRYAALRQVYYALILAQWYKRSGGVRTDTRDLSGLGSKAPWSKETYFREYQKSFRNGEYDISEARDGRVRRYVSGGFVMGDVIPAVPAKTVDEIASREHLLLDGGFQRIPAHQLFQEEADHAFLEPLTEAQAAKLFNEAIGTDNRIHELFLSDKAYTAKARELSGLLTLMETQLFRLDVLTAADMRAVSGLHARLYAHFTRSADASDGERRTVYDRYVSNLVPIDNFSDDLVPWISTRRINWSEVPSLHTLWNILHQCLLMDAPSIGIGTQTNKRIDGWDRDFVIVGKHDEHVDRLLSLFEEINKGEYSAIIIVNEGGGRLAVNIRELPEGHSGVVHINFPDNTVEWRLWMYSERQAVIEESRFRNAGFTLVSSRSNYVLGSESADHLKDVFSIVVDKDESSALKDGGRKAKQTAIAARASGINGAIYDVFLSGDTYEVKVKKFARLLAEYEDMLYALGVLDGPELGRVRRARERLLHLFHRTQQYGEAEYEVAYDRYIFHLAADDVIFAPPSASGGGLEVAWERIPTLHTLWHVLHEYYLLKFSGIMLPLEEGEARFPVFGPDDEYAARIKEAFTTADPNGYLYPVLLNEGKGKIGVSIRNFFAGDRAVITADFGGNTVEWTFGFDSEAAADREAQRLRDAGFGLCQAKGFYVNGGDSADRLTDILAVVVEMETAAKDGGTAAGMLEAAGVAQCLREAVAEGGLTSRMSEDGQRLELLSAQGEPAGFFYWKLLGKKSVSLRLHVPYGFVDKKPLLKNVLRKLWAKDVEAKLLPGASGSQALLVTWPERAPARDGGDAGRIIEETGIREALQSAAGKAGYVALVDPRRPHINLYSRLTDSRPEGGFVWTMTGRKIRLSLVWAAEGHASQQMITWTMAALEQKGLIVSRVPGLPVLVVSLARETELTQDVRVLLEYLSDPANDPDTDRFHDRVYDLGYLTEYGDEFDEVLFSLMWTDIGKYYPGLARLLTAVSRATRYPSLMFALEAAVAGAAGDILDSKLPIEARSRALALIVKSERMFSSQEVFFRKEPGLRPLTDGGVGGIDLRALPVAGVPAAVLLRSLSGGRETRIADLDAEFGKISRLFGMDAAPSCQRIKEFVLACWRGGELGRRSGEARECLARLFRAQEARSEPADGDTRVLLAVVSGS